MAKTLTSSIKVQVSGQAVDNQDLSSNAGNTLYTRMIALANGVGLNQADRMFSDRRTLSASANEDLDLAGGSLLDTLGDALALVKVKALVIYAAAANPNPLNVTRPAAGAPIFLAASDGVAIPPGGFLALAWPSAAGVAVTPTTADLINIANTGAGDVTYDVLVIGASA
jgi:hypothetical protein